MGFIEEKDIQNNKEANENSNQNLIVGRNPCMEVLRSGRQIDRLLVAHGSNTGSTQAIIAKCRARGILVKEVSPAKLDYLSGGAVHQGVAVFVASHEYCSVQDILDFSVEKGEKPFVIICDEIEDPHNLGAIIRTAEACGVHGVIIPQRRSASLNATVAKASSGALEYMKVARVTNITSTIGELKDKGLWIFGADMDGENWCQTDFDIPCAIVIGSEGNGIGTLVKKNCDKIISMPMCGRINSLNASVAAGVLMYEVARQRLKIKAL